MDREFHNAAGAVRAQKVVFAAVVASTLLWLPACEREPREPSESALRQAQVSIFNATHDVLVIDNANLRAEYPVDCALVTDDPSRYLGTEHLGSALRLELLSGEERSLTYDDADSSAASHPCTFSFVTPIDDRLDPIAASWPRDLEIKQFYGDVEAPPDVLPEEQTIVAEAIYDDVDEEELRPWRHRPCESAESLNLANCSEEEFARLMQPPAGASYHWSVLGDEPRLRPWEPTSLSAMSSADPESPDCHTGRSETPLRWDLPPTGSWTVGEIHEVIEYPNRDDEGNEVDGDDERPIADEWSCYDVELLSEQNQRSWGFCGSQRLALRLQTVTEGGTVHVEFFRNNRYDIAPAAYEALTVDIERWTEDGVRYEDEIIEMVRGHGVPEHIGLTWWTESRLSCDPRREFFNCHTVVLPSKLHVESSIGVLQASPGETVDLDPSSPDRIELRRRLEYVRGFHRAVSDRSCSDPSLGRSELTQTGPYIEILYYGGVKPING